MQTKKIVTHVIACQVSAKCLAKQLTAIAQTRALATHQQNAVEVATEVPFMHTILQYA